MEGPFVGVKERREREKEVLRQEILDAARELFVKEGYENVSMRKVAEKIEYSPTTIYLYFNSKADLLYSLCDETFAKLMKKLESLSEDCNDPLVCLRKGLKAYIEFGLKHPNHYKVTFINHPEHHEDDRYMAEHSMGQKAYSHMRMRVAECVQQKKFRQIDIEATTQILWAAIHGLTSLLIGHPDFPWVDKNVLIDHLINTVIESLMA
jgi:AcrR family transcriptional regulator